MIPFFEKGDPLSAGKFNALGDSIRALSGAGSVAGEMVVPQHFDPEPLPEMDFSVIFRKDDAGAWGWCCHKGRVIVKGKEHPVGEKEWALIADSAYKGDMKLVVHLDDQGEFSSAEVQKGKAAEGSETVKEFPLATIDKDLVWQHAGGPVYILPKSMTVTGREGIKVEETTDETTGGAAYEVRALAGKGIQIKADKKAEGGEGEQTPPEKEEKKICADIRNSREGTSGEYSLLYEPEEAPDGGGAGGGEKKEDPIYLKLIHGAGGCEIADENGMLTITAAKKPEAGDGLEYKKEDATGDETNVLQVKIHQANSGEETNVKLEFKDGGLSATYTGTPGEGSLPKDGPGLEYIDGNTLKVKVYNGESSGKNNVTLTVDQNGLSATYTGAGESGMPAAGPGLEYVDGDTLKVKVNNGSSPGNNVTLTAGPDGLSASADFETVVQSASGAGQSLVQASWAEGAILYRLRAGENVSIGPEGGDLVISAAGGGSGGGVIDYTLAVTGGSSSNNAQIELRNAAGALKGSVLFTSSNNSIKITVV